MPRLWGGDGGGPLPTVGAPTGTQRLCLELDGGHGRHHQTDDLWPWRYLSVVPLPSIDRRPGRRHTGGDDPWSVLVGIGQWRGPQRACRGRRLARATCTLGHDARGNRHHQAVALGQAGQTRQRQVFHHRTGQNVDPTGHTATHLCGHRRPDHGQLVWP